MSNVDSMPFHWQTEQNSQSEDHSLETCSVLNVFEKTENRSREQQSKGTTVFK